MQKTVQQEGAKRQGNINGFWGMQEGFIRVLAKQVEETQGQSLRSADPYSEIPLRLALNGATLNFSLSEVLKVMGRELQEKGIVITDNKELLEYLVMKLESKSGPNPEPHLVENAGECKQAETCHSDARNVLREAYRRKKVLKSHVQRKEAWRNWTHDDRNTPENYAEIRLGQWGIDISKIEQISKPIDYSRILVARFIEEALSRSENELRMLGPARMDAIIMRIGGEPACDLLSEPIAFEVLGKEYIRAVAENMEIKSDSGLKEGIASNPLVSLLPEVAISFAACDEPLLRGAIFGNASARKVLPVHVHQAGLADPKWIVRMTATEILDGSEGIPAECIWERFLDENRSVRRAAYGNIRAILAVSDFLVSQLGNKQAGFLDLGEEGRRHKGRMMLEPDAAKDLISKTIEDTFKMKMLDDAQREKLEQLRSLCRASEIRDSEMFVGLATPQEIKAEEAFERYLQRKSE